MERKHFMFLAVAGGLGLLLQGLGVARVFVGALSEFDLAVGIGLYLVGSFLSMWAVEFCAGAKGRSGAWSLLSLLGPLGAAAVVVLKDGSKGRKQEFSKSAASRRVSVFGVLLTFLMSVGFLWAGIWWVDFVRVPSAESEYREMLVNERKTFGHLGEIARAQESYRERDWDGDGEREYARFLIHLWRSVDGNSDPVAVNLISRGLGFAMARSLPLDGYSYESIYYQELSEEEKEAAQAASGEYVPYGSRQIDSSQEWAMAAHPGAAAEQKGLSFIFHSSGAVYGRVLDIPTVGIFPMAPVSKGWAKISSLADLKALQEDLETSRLP